MADGVEVKFDPKKFNDLIERIKKKTQSVKDDKKFFALLGAIIIADVIDHFENQESPTGRWKTWSRTYAEHMARIGKGGNKILQDTGRLKGGWVPTRFQNTAEGPMWFNPVKYSKVHDEGGRFIPQRKFAWLSDKALDNISKQTVKFLEDL